MVRVADRGCAREEGAPDSNKPPHITTAILPAAFDVFPDGFAPFLLIAGILLVARYRTWKACARTGGGGVASSEEQVL